MKDPGDYFDEEINFVATEEDLLAIGASVPNKDKSPQVEEKTKYKSFTGTIKTNEATTTLPVNYDLRPPVEVPKESDEEKNRNRDFQYARENLYNIIETASNALNHLMQIAGQSQHPRAFEVLATLTKTIADANRDLLKLHAEKQKIDGIAPPSNTPIDGSNITNNNLFVGTTAELDEMIKKLGLTKTNKDV